MQTGTNNRNSSIFYEGTQQSPQKSKNQTRTESKKKDACVGGEEKEREEPAGGKRVAGLGQTKDARNNFIQTLPIILAVPIHSIMYSRIWSLSLKQIDIQSGCLAHHCKLLISPSAW